VTESGTGSKWLHLTDEERDRFRAEDCCFYCREIGHQKRNCPLVHHAPAHKIRSDAATVEHDSYSYLKSIGVWK
jgi:hypothetical protein